MTGSVALDSSDHVHQQMFGVVELSMDIENEVCSLPPATGQRTTTHQPAVEDYRSEHSTSLRGWWRYAEPAKAA